MGKKILTGLIAVSGLGFFLLAFFALQLGVGHSSRWGHGRILVAAVGIFLSLLALLIFSWSFWVRLLGRVKQFVATRVGDFLALPPVGRFLQGIRSNINRWKNGWDRLPIARALRKARSSRLVGYLADSQDRKASLGAIILGIVIITIYVWFVSVGKWTEWPKTTTYYDQLADAFLHGQTSLMVTPKPDLLNLADPYNYVNREHISSYPWDAVLYHGKFYIYWGPAPALVLAAVKFFFRTEIGDQVVVFGAVVGTFLFAALLILRLRRRLFPALGWPYVIPAVLVAGLINPLPWILNRPAIYEAAIATAQCFLIAGLYFGFTSVDGQVSVPWRAALASTFWLLSIASRFTLAPAVGFLLLVMAWRMLRQKSRGAQRVASLGALFLPFAAGLLGLGWYNLIRFGSWLETGMRYQLSGINVHALGFNVFSLKNFLYDLNNYLITPYRVLSVFPYVKPDWGGSFIFFPVGGSAYSNSEQVSGLITTVPYVIFAAIPLAILVWQAWQAVVRKTRPQSTPETLISDSFLEWTAFMLSGAFCLSFAPSLLYMTTSMRYLGDSVPLLSLLSTFGVLWGAQSLAAKRAARGWFMTLVVVLMMFSVLISLLLAVTSYEARFEHMNPALFAYLTHVLPQFK